HGIPAAAGRELAWILEETPALTRFRADLPPEARAGLSEAGERSKAAEQEPVRRLWQACLHAAGRALPKLEVGLRDSARWRDGIVQAGGPDIDSWIHPPLIRFLAGYLDQGLTHWAMPARELGIHGCFLDLYATPLAGHCGPWARRLPGMVAEDRQAGRGALASLAHSLEEMGIAGEDASDFLTAELLALRGWAGMVRQIELRPDRVPARELRVTLRGYMAVRLLLLRAALAEAGRQMGFDGPPAGLRTWVLARTPAPAPPSAAERAWPLFQAAQLMGLDAALPARWTADAVAAIEGELAAIHPLCRRRILHQALERTARHRLYDALLQHRPPAAPASPAFQTVFCLDEREESLRRHLEEVDAGCETFSTAGFFNVAMYHQGATDAHPRPLCPATVRPEHYVREAGLDVSAPLSRSRHGAGFLGYNVHLTSRSAFGGALLMTLFGWMALVPLVLRVIFPWLNSRWRRVVAPQDTGRGTRLQLDRVPDAPPVGRFSGFTVGEMAEIVRRVLEDTGLGGQLAPLVVLFAHGSVSLNNPHESAHDCGACGGGRGGPNARAFAQMANDPRVRRQLAEEGLRIPAETWFVGAQRNTCNNQLLFFDTDLIPDGGRELWERAQRTFETARRREAHERCRRFDVPGWFPPRAALTHVQGRAADLAQPRPEYGHATNAFCIVGRRARTRGLFLDRRAFLISYDPHQDADGALLGRILRAAVPVVAGISLEYYFSYVDPVGYGCGTKLPHNVTALLGVMDGAQSDLRTGLPWQMVEIHEPVRLAMVVEASRERLAQVVAADPELEQLVRNRWFWLACLEPESAVLWEMEAGGFAAWRPARPLPVITGDSAAWYQGKRGFVLPATIVPPAGGVAASA
ncbi:MAG TPA: putative inorganic carbon transporter subunit DabA, partial [Terriglobales bacterium]|nr:putative inorganic carbon transporter subunit DabA [Terriglobales bacterium]